MKELHQLDIYQYKESLYPFLLLLHTASPWPSCSSRPEALNLGFGHCLLSLDVVDPCKDVWVGLADDVLHPGMPSLSELGGSFH